MRPTFSATRIFLIEMKLGPQDWPTVLPIVDSALNWVHLERLGSRPDVTPREPLEVMMGILPPRPISLFVPPEAATTALVTLNEARLMQLLRIAEIQMAIDNMHLTEATAATQLRKETVDKQNRDTNVVRPSFTCDAYVLVRRVVDRFHELRPKWYGPCVVTEVHGPLVFTVRSFISGRSEHPHAARLFYYHDGKNSTSLSSDQRNIVDRTESQFKLIDSIVDIGCDANDGLLYLHIVWDGLPDAIN